MNNKKFIVLVLIFGVFIPSIFIQRNKIVSLEEEVIQLENEQKENIASEITLENCPLCEGHPILQLVNQSFYIECKDCKLRTNYFDSKYELIKYWNNRN